MKNSNSPRKKQKMAVAPADDMNVDCLRPLISPAILHEEIPITSNGIETVKNARAIVKKILRGEDDRLLAIVGPCSVHDADAAREYAAKLAKLAKDVAKDVVIIMRVYFEKPRTTIGWKGLINDPELDGTFQINKGLRQARTLLSDIAEMGLPAGCELLDTISPQYISDLVAWGAIGARTTESQVHRELASGVSCPVGFKNGTDGNIQIAVDAIRSSSQPHNFLGVTKQGLAAIVSTTGNDACHVILRGANTGPNYDAENVKKVSDKLASVKLPVKIMIDCSHGNSKKNHKNQPLVADNIAEQVSAGDKAIFGVMIESNLNEGRQDLVEGQKEKLKYGVSITDACVHWDDTVSCINTLAAAVQKRRTVKK
eukprot:GFYU01001740.1.p1 GENE.GFYU01001740.1~~GFYU01001740.1.p1  ORF type:complete len:382 (+),score=107.93 GFYU01001740.1:38-1147(+)